MFSVFSSWTGLIAFLVGSFLLANIIAVWMSKKRADRIIQKSTKLAAQVLPPGSAPTPVTIVTGFLGSGKTTLVNRLLKDPRGKRIAVIENEVGAISIDHELLKYNANGPEGHPTKNVFVLKNGCICCTRDSAGGDELERTLDVLLQLVDGSPEAFNYVVIECSGLADPAPVVQMFFRPGMAKSRFVLDGVITVVDGKHINHHIPLMVHGATPAPSPRGTVRTIEAEKQIAAADVILLNKADLLTPKEVEDVTVSVRHVNATANIHPCTYTEVDTAQLLGLKAYELQAARDVPNVMTSHCCDGEGVDHHHTKHIASVSLSCAQPLSLPKLRAWLQSLIDVDWHDLYRIKGILHIEGHSKRFVVHGVHAELIGDFEDAKGESKGNSSSGVVGGDGVSRIVLIGKHLKHDELQAGFLACVAEDHSDAVPSATTTVTTEGEDSKATATTETKSVRQRRRVD